jgi:hypothetical protein
MSRRASATAWVEDADSGGGDDRGRRGAGGAGNLEAGDGRWFGRHHEGRRIRREPTEIGSRRGREAGCAGEETGVAEGGRKMIRRGIARSPVGDDAEVGQRSVRQEEGREIDNGLGDRPRDRRMSRAEEQHRHRVEGGDGGAQSDVSKGCRHRPGWLSGGSGPGGLHFPTMSDRIAGHNRRRCRRGSGRQQPVRRSCPHRSIEMGRPCLPRNRATHPAVTIRYPTAGSVRISRGWRGSASSLRRSCPT